MDLERWLSVQVSLLLKLMQEGQWLTRSSEGTSADLWHAQARGRAALFFIMAPFLGPALGPLTGAYIISEYHNNWRYSMWVIMMIAAPVPIMALFMSETSHSRILYLRQKKQGVKVPHQTGDTRLLLRKLQAAFIRPLHMMFVEVSVLSMLIVGLS